jgi:hypothetical protein
MQVPVTKFLPSRIANEMHHGDRDSCGGKSGALPPFRRAGRIGAAKTAAQTLAETASCPAGMLVQEFHKKN